MIVRAGVALRPWHVQLAAETVERWSRLPQNVSSEKGAVNLFGHTQNRHLERTAVLTASS